MSKILPPVTDIEPVVPPVPPVVEPAKVAAELNKPTDEDLAAHPYEVCENRSITPPRGDILPAGALVRADDYEPQVMKALLERGIIKCR